MPIFDIAGFGTSRRDGVDLLNVTRFDKINVGIADHEGAFAIKFDGVRVDIIYGNRPITVG